MENHQQHQHHHHLAVRGGAPGGGAFLAARGGTAARLCDGPSLQTSSAVQTLQDQQHQHQHQHQAYRAAAAAVTAPRSAACSPNWRSLQPAADYSSSYMASSAGNYTLVGATGTGPAAAAAAAAALPRTMMETCPSSSSTSTSSSSSLSSSSEQQHQHQHQHQQQNQHHQGLEGYAYVLDRGNGQFTRLVPADMLPPLNEIPTHQPSPNGMVVLPELQKAPPHGVAEMNRPVTMKRQIDRIVATTPTTPKRTKIYCDKWVHEGVCAFTQQGCKYKHEMPFDRATQHSLGLYQGLPLWFRKHQAELQRQKDAAAAAAAAATKKEEPLSPETVGSGSGSGGRRALAAAAERHAVVGSGKGGGSATATAWRKTNGAGVSSAMDLTKRTDALRPLSIRATGSPSRNIWGPIEPPQKPRYGSGSGSESSSPCDAAAGRESWPMGQRSSSGKSV